MFLRFLFALKLIQKTQVNPKNTVFANLFSFFGEQKPIFSNLLGYILILLQKRKIIIVGSGPASYTAAIIAARANLSAPYF
jgi:hypothetical protein